MNLRVVDRLSHLRAWAERATEVDLGYIFSGGSWLSVSYLTGSFSAFILSLVFANFLLPNTYGAYRYVLSVANIVGVLTLPGLDTSLVRSVARGLEGATYQVMFTRIRFGLLAGAATLCISAYYWFQGNVALAEGFAIMAIFIPSMDTLGSWADLFSGRKAFRLFAKVGVVTRIAGTLILIGTALFLPSLAWLSLAYFGGWTLVQGTALVYTLMRHPPNGVRDPNVISYGKHITIMKGVSTIASSIGSIVLFHVGGVALAVYAIAIAPIEQTRGLFGLLQSLALPKFSQDEWRVWTPHTFLKKTGLLFLLLSSGVSAYVLAAPYLYSLLFPKYLAAVPYTQAWAPSLLLTIFILLLSTILQAKQEVRKLYVFNTVSITAILVLTPIGTYLYGIWGLLGAQALVKLAETVTLCYLAWTKRFSANPTDNTTEENGISESP